jgi:hypothetical protein
VVLGTPQSSLLKLKLRLGKRVIRPSEGREYLGKPKGPTRFDVIQITNLLIMDRYPLSADKRKDKRRGILDRLLAEARLKAAASGRSLNCQERAFHYGAVHEPCLGGPGNCLCECHDSEAAISVSS